MSDAGSDDDEAWKPCGDSLAPVGDVPAPQDDRMYLFRLRCGTGCSLICCNFETAAFLNLTHYARTRSGQPMTVVVESAEKLKRWRVRTLHKNQREDYLFWLDLKRTGSPQAVTVDGKLYPAVPMIKVLETWITHSFFAGLRQEHLEALSADHDVHPKIMPPFEHGGIYMKHNFNMLHACSNDMRRELAEVVAMAAAGKIYLSSDANKKALFEEVILVKDYQDIKFLKGKHDSIGPILGQMYTECLGATDPFSAASNQPKHYYNTLAKLMEAYKTLYGAPQLFDINNNLRGGVENQTGAHWLVQHAAEENEEVGRAPTSVLPTYRLSRCACVCGAERSLFSDRQGPAARSERHHHRQRRKPPYGIRGAGDEAAQGRGPDQ